MRNIKWSLHTGYAGCTHTGEIEVEDDATEEEIDEAVREDAWNYLDLFWEESEE